MKRGWKTTEFWIATITTVGTVASALAGVLPPNTAAIAAAVSTAAYSLARGLAKAGSGIEAE